MLAKKFRAGCFLLCCLASPLYGQDPGDADQLEQVVSFQKKRIEILRERLSRLRGSQGEVLANGITIVDSTRKWVGPLPGLQGPKGLLGAPGTNGTHGRDGTNGVNGRDGRKGTNGQKGARGLRGPQGERGERGETGDRGPMGTCI